MGSNALEKVSSRPLLNIVARERWVQANGRPPPDPMSPAPRVHCQRPRVRATLRVYTSLAGCDGGGDAQSHLGS